jgi:hypothetical protein
MRIMRVFCAPLAFSYGVFLLMFMENIWIYLATAACLTFVAAATALGIDDRYGTDPLFAALPATRRDLVKGRYLAWAAVTVAGLALFLAYTVLLHAGFGERSPRLGTLLSLKGAAAFLAGTLFTGLVFLPFHFRLGFWRGMWGFTGVSFVLSVAALNAIAQFVPAEAYGAASSIDTLPAAFRPTARGLRAFAWLIDRYMGTPLVAAAAAFVLAILIYLSYRLSVCFYRKRDL